MLVTTVFGIPNNNVYLSPLKLVLLMIKSYDKRSIRTLFCSTNICIYKRTDLLNYGILMVS